MTTAEQLHKSSPFRDPVKLAEAAAIYRRALARPNPRGEPEEREQEQEREAS